MRRSHREVLEYIKSFMMENGYTPTMRQIGNGVELKSTSSVQMYFERLVRRGDVKPHGKNYTVKGMKFVEG